MNIEIGTCELEIRRPRGTAPPWADEADHRALADKVQRLVLAMLEDLVAPRLPQDETVLADLVIDLPLKAPDLEGAAPLARAGLRAALREAVERAVARAVPGKPNDTTSKTRARDRATPPATESGQSPRLPSEAIARTALYTLIETLFPRGTPASAVALIPQVALARLLRRAHALLPQVASVAASAGDAARSQSRRGRATQDHRADLVAALADIAVALATHRAAPPEALPVVAPVIAQARQRAENILAALESPEHQAPDDTLPHRAKGLPSNSSDAQQAKRIAPSAANPAPLPPGPAPANDTDILPNGTYRLDHVLPFLVYAALHDRGLTDPLSLDIEVPAVMAPLAAAIASVCLPRSSPLPDPAISTAVARFAGRKTLPDTSDYTFAAARIDGAPYTRATLAQSLLGSLLQSPTTPLVLSDDRVTLFDPGGLFPVASGPPDTLTEMLAELDRTYFTAGEAPETWAELARAGLPLVASGAPVSGEAARMIAGPNGWVGRSTSNRRLPCETLPEEAEHAENARAIWHALTDAAPLRPPFRSASEADFTDFAAILAGYGLADLGWRFLGRDRAAWERPDPALVQRRFFDLGGEMRVNDRCIDIHLPMGRRYLDLRDAGLLTTVDAPVWWGDRRLEFSGG